MNLRNEEQPKEITNVLSLFGAARDEGIVIDPLADLLAEGNLEDFTLEEEIEKQQVMAQRHVVNEDQFPDQSIYILEEQLSKLKTNLNRIKFYLGDMNDLLV